jgi:hypothetical protein
VEKWCRKIRHFWKAWKSVANWVIFGIVVLVVIYFVGKWRGWWGLGTFLFGVTEISTVVALILTISSLLNSKKIAKEISTRFIGPFPDHLNEIVDHVNHAEKSVDALWDAVDPGSYFSPEAHQRLLDTMKGKSRRIKVRFLIWGGPTAVSLAGGAEETDPQRTERTKGFCEFYVKRKGFTEHLEEMLDRVRKRESIGSGITADRILRYLSKPDSAFAELFRNTFNKMKVSPGITAEQMLKCLSERDKRFIELLRDMFNRMEARETIGPDMTARQLFEYLRAPDADLLGSTSKKKFRALQLCLHEWVRRQLVDADASVLENDGVIPEMFFWIMDGHKAVFLFPSATEKALAFVTQDQNLVNTLKTIFEQRWDEIDARDKHVRSSVNAPVQETS